MHIFKDKLYIIFLNPPKKVTNLNVFFESGVFKIYRVHH